MPAEHFCGASKDLKRTDQIEDLCPRRCNEHDASRPRWDWLLIIKVRAGLAVYSFHRLVASSCQFDSSPTPLLGRGGEANKFESTHSFWLVTCHTSLACRSVGHRGDRRRVTILLKQIFRQNLQNRQNHFFNSDNSVHPVLILSVRLLTYSSPRSRRRGEEIAPSPPNCWLVTRHSYNLLSTNLSGAASNVSLSSWEQK